MFICHSVFFALIGNCKKAKISLNLSPYLLYIIVKNVVLSLVVKNVLVKLVFPFFSGHLKGATPTSIHCLASTNLCFYNPPLYAGTRSTGRGVSSFFRGKATELHCRFAAPKVSLSIQQDVLHPLLLKCFPSVYTE